MGLILLASLRVLGVSIIPVVTNDSVGYLSHSQSLGSDGLVWAGFRQIGYPTYLAAVDLLGTVTSTEPILLAVVLQRGLLMVGLAYAVWLLRWWAIPLAVVATAPDLVGYTNFVLVEGMAIPIALLVGLLMIHSVLLLSRDAPQLPGSSRFNWDRSRVDLWSVRVTAALAGGAVVGMTLLKYQSIVLVLPLIAVLLTLLRTVEHRKFSMLLAAGVLSLLAGISVAQSVENYVEHDDFFPLSRGVRNAYWGTFQNVFNLHPENQNNPDLEMYWSGGSPWPFIREVESTYPDYSQQREVFENAIDDMLERGGLDKRQEQIKATWAVMKGGRIDDVGHIIVLMRRANAGNVYSVVHKNALANERGVATYLSVYNGGQRIEPVMTAPLFPSFSGILARPLLMWMGPVMIVSMLAAAAFGRRHRILFMATVVSAIVVFVFLGSLLVDNYRYVIATLVFLLPVSTLAAITIARRSTSSLPTKHTPRADSQIAT